MEASKPFILNQCTIIYVYQPYIAPRYANTSVIAAITLLEARKTVIWKHCTIFYVPQPYIASIYENIMLIINITLTGRKKNPYLDPMCHNLFSSVIHSCFVPKHFGNSYHYLNWKQEKPLFGSIVPYFIFFNNI